MKTAHLTTATRPAITSTAGALSDRELLRETRNLVRHERHLQGAIIDHLAEIEARGLYLQRGFSSLFDYAVRELGYSDAAAARRIGAMRLCADQPHAREGLREGSLTLSAAAELQWAFDRQRRRGSISGTAAIAPAGAGSAVQNDPAADSAPAVPLILRRAAAAAAGAGCGGAAEARGRGRRQERPAGPPDAGRRGPGAGAAGRPGAPARRRPLRVEGDYRRGVPAGVGAAPGAALARGPAHDHGAACRTLGQGGARPPRAGHRAERAAAVGPRTRRQTPRELRRRSRRNGTALRRRSTPRVRRTPRRRRRPTRTQTTTPLRRRSRSRLCSDAPLRRRRTRRSPPAPLPHRRGRFGRYRPSRRAPPLRRRSHALRAARFRRVSDDRCGNATAGAAATSIHRPGAVATQRI